MALSIAGAVASIAFFLFLVAVPQADPAPDAPSGPPVTLILLAIGVLARTLWEPLVWWSRTYTVGADHLVVDEGVVSRHRRVVPYDRIQQVDIQRPLIAQVLSVAVLQIDTAGESGTTSVALRFLDLPHAEGLRSFLLRRRDELQRPLQRAGSPPPLVPGAPPPPVGAAPPSQPVVEQTILRVGPADLAVAGLTGDGVVVGAPIVAVAVTWGAAYAVSNGGAAAAALVGALGIGAVILVASAAVRALSEVVSRHGFTLSVRGDDLHLRFGLLDVRQLTVPRRRVQRIVLIDNPLRRLLGFTSIALRTAAAPGGSAGSTAFVIPHVPRSRVGEVLAAVSGDGTWVVPPISPRSAPARRRGIRRRTFGLAAVLAVPAVVLGPVGLLVLSLALLGVPWGLLAHARAGHGVSPAVVALAHGALRHRIEIVPVNRIQSCRIRSSPFQRRAGLATFLIDVAGAATLAEGSPDLYDLEVHRAEALLASLARGRLPSGAG